MDDKGWFLQLSTESQPESPYDLVSGMPLVPNPCFSDVSSVHSSKTSVRLGQTRGVRHREPCSIDLERHGVKRVTPRHSTRTLQNTVTDYDSNTTANDVRVVDPWYRIHESKNPSVLTSQNRRPRSLQYTQLSERVDRGRRSDEKDLRSQDSKTLVPVKTLTTVSTVDGPP